MNLQEYKPLALAFCVSKGYNFDLQHAAMGMITEAGELIDAVKRQMIYGKDIDAVNLKEEVGDCLWYANVAADTIGWRLSGEVLPSMQNNLFDKRTTLFTLSIALNGAAAAFGGCVSEITEGDKASYADELPDWLSCYAAALAEFGRRFGFTLEDAADANIAKLQKRFPNGFTAHAALNRDTAAERAVLEGTDAGN